MRQPAVVDDLLELIFGTDERVSTTIEGVQAGELIDPTADTVQLAILDGDDPVSGASWQAGTWETDNTGREPAYSASWKPTGIVQGVTYAMYAKVTHGDTTVIGFCGHVRWR